jgi:hypothetical protein
MRDRLIISLILVLMAYLVCGCEEEPEYGELGEMLLWCQSCQKTIGGTYFIDDGYCFECATCQTIYANAQWEKVGNQKYKEMFGVDLIRMESITPAHDMEELGHSCELPGCSLGIAGRNKPNEPNEAPYKAWFGWE